MSSPRQNSNYEKYIHSKGWRVKADERLMLDGHKCCVCGGEATDVHHLTYERFGCESMDDLVSLCRRCHKKAEDIYDPAVYPWAMDEVKPEGNNFMAAMRADAMFIAPVVYDYIRTARGCDFDALMSLRQPNDPDGKKYWYVLHAAVNALCRKRYSMNCAADRIDMMTSSVTNHVSVICLGQIEHQIRNAVQKDLHETVTLEYAIWEKWKDVSAYLGISPGTTNKLRSDDGTSFGPSLRETVLYYCALDASAGIPPLRGFQCLTDDDYKQLTVLSEYMVSVSGSGAFKGEFNKEDIKNA